LKQAPAAGKIALPSSDPPPPAPTPPVGRSEAEQATPAATARELESLKSDMKKKEGELEALRKELEAIKRQLAEQAAQNSTQTTAPPKRPKNSSAK
jgi:Skp family chaperone for outer membrane proteins